MHRKALFKAAPSAVALCAACATMAAPPLAPACVVSISNPTWADCAGAMLQAASDDAAAGSFAHGAGALGSSIDFTVLAVSINSARGERAPAPGYLAQVIPSIPEPQTMVLMLAGLAVMGFMATRRHDR